MWKTDLSRSAKAFEFLVWPVLRQVIGGKLVHVELIARQDFAKDLDVRAGIDAWHIHDRGIRGLASRVQAGRAWDTFTVRRSRATGVATEYEKRCYAIQAGEGWIYPHLTIQAYITAWDMGRLLSVGVARTADLMRFIQAHEDTVTVRSAPDGNTFFVVPFDAVAVYQAKGGEGSVSQSAE